MDNNITNFTCAAVLHFLRLVINDEFIEMKYNNSIKPKKKMESKVRYVCNTGKSIENSYNKYRECEPFNIQRIMKRFNEKKDNV